MELSENSGVCLTAFKRIIHQINNTPQNHDSKVEPTSSKPSPSQIQSALLCIYSEAALLLKTTIKIPAFNELVDVTAQLIKSQSSSSPLSSRKILLSLSMQWCLAVSFSLLPSLPNSTLNLLRNAYITILKVPEILQASMSIKKATNDVFFSKYPSAYTYAIHLALQCPECEYDQRKECLRRLTIFNFLTQCIAYMGQIVLQLRDFNDHIPIQLLICYKPINQSFQDLQFQLIHMILSIGNSHGNQHDVYSLSQFASAYGSRECTLWLSGLASSSIPVRYSHDENLSSLSGWSDSASVSSAASYLESMSSTYSRSINEEECSITTSRTGASTDSATSPSPWKRQRESLPCGSLDLLSYVASLIDHKN